ncbi:hypothetical protein K402DRAFT_167328 [Aulographum hederae CBS 113979]|uniref:Uncharacterized protein n=1 Tax=Aulographum hederae CBS 113979 TaxID=1176131 RepID=A0A6G1GRU3_9PEZI|nr:hypothetical protein K402DRAFT_167328 [Aulographum hederae CBS 113979]
MAGLNVIQYDGSSSRAKRIAPSEWEQRKEELHRLYRIFARIERSRILLIWSNKLHPFHLQTSNMSNNSGSGISQNTTSSAKHLRRLGPAFQSDSQMSQEVLD